MGILPKLEERMWAHLDAAVMHYFTPCQYRSHKAFVEAAAKARQHLLEFATVAEEDEFPLGTFGLCPWKVVHQRCWYILDLGGKSRILQWLWLRPSGLITTDSAVNPGPHRARSRLEPQVLAQQTPGSGAVIAAARDDRLAEAVGSSVSTMDSSYTAEASVSSELSPSGIVTTSPGKDSSGHRVVSELPLENSRALAWQLLGTRDPYPPRDAALHTPGLLLQRPLRPGT
ncbi:hypothetical protein VOLCADRAFT_100697 [Volvox carteri f. nagariensis]|uniref:Uncharacterized protein n=1 Tax=Volvox carteri f. nagariensis TaxID=3068 RepID=D8UKT6_VOLCA|nr:uncharacterized protein VOLCADRAFT_100697 [Volvox carteri f. nagariensis]EFJ39663.1 hypothetical protein VOLCADRAFT_100697 [Volvox carteri f. nagariensis]|eukprot:XP_002959273.1 hypothetical protein VOLCADRAFT_100697 [Volvox carteri f. nagariensis]